MSLISDLRCATEASSRGVARFCLAPDDRFALHVLAHNLNAGELDLDSGFAVTVEGNDDGHVAVVESVNVDLFRRRMIESLSRSTAR